MSHPIAVLDPPLRDALAEDGEEAGSDIPVERCGEVRPGNPHALAVIRGAVRKAFGYDASFRKFPIVGVCPRCSEEKRP